MKVKLVTFTNNPTDWYYASLGTRHMCAINDDINLAWI